MAQKLSLDDLLLFDTLHKPKATSSSVSNNTNGNNNGNVPLSNASQSGRQTFNKNALDLLYQNTPPNRASPALSVKSFPSNGSSGILQPTQTLGTPTEAQDKEDQDEDDDDDFGDFVESEDPTFNTIPEITSNHVEPSIPPSSFATLAFSGSKFGELNQDWDNNTNKTEEEVQAKPSPNLPTVSNLNDLSSNFGGLNIQIPGAISGTETSKFGQNNVPWSDSNNISNNYNKGDLEVEEEEEDSFGDFDEFREEEKGADTDIPSNSVFNPTSISSNPHAPMTISTSSAVSSTYSNPSLLSPLPSPTAHKSSINPDITSGKSLPKQSSITEKRPEYSIQGRINELNAHDTSKPLSFGAHVTTGKKVTTTTQTDNNIIGEAVSGNWTDVLTARTGPGSGMVNSDTIQKVEQKDKKKEELIQKAEPKKHILMKSNKGAENFASKLVYNKRLTDFSPEAVEKSPPTLLSHSTSPGNSTDKPVRNEDGEFDFFASHYSSSASNLSELKHDTNILKRQLGMKTFGLSTGSMSSIDGSHIPAKSKTSTVDSPSASLIDIFSDPEPAISSPSLPCNSALPSLAGLSSSFSTNGSPSSPITANSPLGLPSHSASSPLTSLPTPLVARSTPSPSNLHLNSPSLSNTFTLPVLSATPSPPPKERTTGLGILSPDFDSFSKSNVKEDELKKTVEHPQEEEADDDWDDFQDFNNGTPSFPAEKVSHKLVSSSDSNSDTLSKASSVVAAAHKRTTSSVGSKLFLGSVKSNAVTSTSHSTSVLPHVYRSIPSSIELLHLFNETVLHVADPLFNSLVPLNYKLKKRVLANPKTKEFLLGYLETVMVCAKIMAGRRRRLIIGDIPPAMLLDDDEHGMDTKSKKEGKSKKHMILDELSEKSDREARESERLWSQEIAPRLRAANVAALVLGSSSSFGSPNLNSPESPSSSSSSSKSSSKRYKHLSTLTETGIQAGYLVNGGAIDDSFLRERTTATDKRSNDDISDTSSSQCIVCGLEPGEEVNYLTMTPVAKKKSGSRFGFGKSSSSTKQSRKSLKSADISDEYKWSTDTNLGHATCLKFWEHKGIYGI